VADANFAQALPFALRAVQVRAGLAVATGRAAASDRKDLEQEALFGLFLALPRYDASRAGLRTFVERVADKRFATLLRRRRADLVVERLDGHRIATADGIPEVQLRVDFERVLAPLRSSERALALLLIDHRPAEISDLLGIARSTVYARIARLRRAFRAAGYGPAGSVGDVR
jgi:RNA polymerase sigma-70 factor (ECF subfamily)